MKFLLAFAVIAASSVSFAASERNIYDIMYLPKAGTKYGFTTVENIRGSFKTSGKNFDYDGFQYTQTLGKSFTDNFSLQASLNYVDVSFDENQNNTQKGVSDPMLDARYRLLDESLLWDVLAKVVMGPGVKEFESNGDTNNYTGNVALSLGTQIGQKFGSFQWAGLVQYNRHFKTTYKTDGLTGELSPYNEVLARADILNKFTESSMLRTFAGIQFLTFGDNVDLYNAIESFGTEYQHLISKDLLLRAGVDYSIIESENYFSTFSDHNQWNFRLGANYQF